MKCKFWENVKLQKREKPLKFNIILSEFGQDLTGNA